MPPSTASVDSPSAAEPQKAIVTCDRRLCFLCGPVTVAQFAARKHGGQLQDVLQISLSDSKEDDPSIPLCLCPTHDRQFCFRQFVFIPSKRRIVSMRDITAEDYEEISAEMEKPNTRSTPIRSFPDMPALSSVPSEDPDVGRSAEAEAQMTRYAKERSVT